jgi:hypothetical protein
VHTSDWSSVAVSDTRIGSPFRVAPWLCHRHVLVVTGDVDDHPDEGCAPVPEGHRHRHLREPVEEVHRAIEGIDDPDSTGPPVVASALLSQHAVFGEVAGDDRL